MTDDEGNGPLECESCGRPGGKAPHTCPYREDINDDHETECNCCDHCEQECAYDI
jgi:hypothetical protein